MIRFALANEGKSLTCDLSLGFNVLFKIWLNKCKPLFDTSFNISSSLFYITEDLTKLVICHSKGHESLLLLDKQVSASASQNI